MRTNTSRAAARLVPAAKGAWSPCPWPSRSCLNRASGGVAWMTLSAMVVSCSHASRSIREGHETGRLCRRLAGGRQHSNTVPNV